MNYSDTIHIPVLKELPSVDRGGNSSKFDEHNTEPYFVHIGKERETFNQFELNVL